MLMILKQSLKVKEILGERQLKSITLTKDFEDNYNSESYQVLPTL